MNWVWLHSPTSGNERLVLLALADACSRDDGTGCWPSVPTIARKANISERSAWRVISRLEAAGHLKVERTGGGTSRNTNSYSLIMQAAQTAVSAAGDPCQDVTPGYPQPLTNGQGRPLATRQGRGDMGDRSGLTQVSPDPPENLKPSPRGTSRSGAAAIADDMTSGTKELIAAYVAACPRRPPGSVLGQLGKHVGAMLAEGIDPAAITRALERFRERPMHPSVLPSLVNEELNQARPADIRPDGRPVADANAVPDADPDDPAAYLAALRGHLSRPAPSRTSERTPR